MKSNRDLELSSCSSDHNDEEESINYISKLENDIVSYLNLEKTFKQKEMQFKKIQSIVTTDEKEETKATKHNFWMLFYKRLFANVISKSEDQITELNILVFRINYVINQNINSLPTPNNPNTKFNPIEKYQEITDLVSRRNLSIANLQKYSELIDEGNTEENEKGKIPRKMGFEHLKKPIILPNEKAPTARLSNYYLNLFDEKKLSKHVFLYLKNHLDLKMMILTQKVIHWFI